MQFDEFFLVLYYIVVAFSWTEFPVVLFFFRYPSGFDLRTINVPGQKHMRYIQIVKVGSVEDRKKLAEERKRQELVSL